MATMRNNNSRAGYLGRSGLPPRPVPASRAPHASTAKIDSTELRNPSAIYTQAELLARQHAPPLAQSANVSGITRKLSSSTATSSSGGAVPSSQNLSPASQSLSRISDLAPHASGSSSTLYRTVLKTPTLTQLYMHGQFSSNAPDVLRQFTAELRFFQTVRRHRNIVAFVGSLEGVGMLLEYVEGDTLWKYLGKGMKPSVRADWFNQILSGVCHIHSFGLAHNDLCSLNVIITTPNSNSSNPTSRATTLKTSSSSSRTPKYVVKLIDFGRSSVEPKPAPVPSALAALRNRNLTPSTFDKEKEKINREKDLIFPGTRPFAAPEIMRAWMLSDAGKSSTANEGSDDEDEDEDESSESGSVLNDEIYGMDILHEQGETDTRGRGHGRLPTSRALSTPRVSLPQPVPPTLPLPLSSPAYQRPDAMLANGHVPVSPTTPRLNLRSRMPIVSFTNDQISRAQAEQASYNVSHPNQAPSSPAASRFASLRTPIPSLNTTKPQLWNDHDDDLDLNNYTPDINYNHNHRTHRTTHIHHDHHDIDTTTRTKHGYPSPTSSPSGSQPSSPLSSGSPNSHANGNAHTNAHARSRSFPHPDYQFSPFRHDGDDIDVDNTAASSTRNTALDSYSYTSSLASPSTSKSKSVPKSTSKSRSKAARRQTKKRNQEKLEALHALDPHPLSAILGDTYSLGVMALCLELDELVDVDPGVQMREEWDWRSLGDGRLLSSTSLEVFVGKNTDKGGKNLLERYLRSVKGRERCKVADAVDVDALRETERLDEIARRAEVNNASRLATTSSNGNGNGNGNGGTSRGRVENDTGTEEMMMDWNHHGDV